MSMYGRFPKVNGKEQKARPVIDCSKAERRTVQSERDSADINKIIGRFEKTGMLANLNKGTPFYGDVSELSGLQEAIIKVQEAEQLFYGMSAHIRERFQNDPVQMVDFLENPDNRAEAIKLGMVLPPPKEVVDTPTPAVPEPQA